MPADHVVRLLAAPEVDGEVVAAWRDLATRAAEPNPCNEPEALLPALRHLAGGTPVRLLVATRGRELDACLPVVPVRRWRSRVPVPALIAWNHPYQLIGTPLVDAQRAVAALTALLRAPRRDRGAAQLMEIEDLGADGPVAAALAEAAAAVDGRLVQWEEHDRAVLSRADGSPGHPRGNRHKRVRRQRRALERDAGSVTVVDRAGDRDAVETFLALEAAGWKGRAGTALACRPGDAAFFRELCANFSRLGRLELRSLEVPAGPVAMQVALRAGGGVFHLKVAYDERHRDHSPGVQLLVDYADGFVGEDIDFRDSCTAAGNVTESHVWPGRRRIATVVLPFSGSVSRTTVTALAAARARRLRADRRPPPN